MFPVRTYLALLLVRIAPVVLSTNAVDSDGKDICAWGRRTTGQHLSDRQSHRHR